MNISVKTVNKINLIFCGLIFWISAMCLLAWLSVNSFSLIWLLGLIVIAVPFALSCAFLGEDGIKTVTGIKLIENIFNIDLTEE